MKLVFPNVNIDKRAFIDFIYQEELLKAAIKEAEKLTCVTPSIDMVLFFTTHGKLNEITRPSKLREIFIHMPGLDPDTKTLAIEATYNWERSLNRSAMVQTEYPMGVYNLELPVMRRFRVLNDDVNFHFLVARSKLSDLAGREGADLFAYFDLNDDNKRLYHGRNLDELMFNMFFGYLSNYPQNKLAVDTFYFDEQLQSCDRGFF